MKILLLSTILLFTVSLNAQSIDVLENKNGYKSLKINSQKSNYKYNLELIENKNGYTSYKYVDAYEIVNETITIQKKTSIYSLANQYRTQRELIEALNPNIIIKAGKLKKNQTLIVPIRKKSTLYSIDRSLFNLFGDKINSINLTFENNSNKLKKISLNLNEIKSLQWMTLLGYNLKELYTEFENIIGQTTEYPKPTSDCYQFKSKSCLYFEDRALNGKILWKSPSVVLEIYQNAEIKVNNNGTMNLIVNRTISFEDKSYYEDKKNSGF